MVEPARFSPLLSPRWRLKLVWPGQCICGYGRNAWSRTHVSREARVKNQTRPDTQHDQEFGPEYGYFGAVAAHAFGAQRHMHEFGTTREDFAEIAMAFREHAVRNPHAQLSKAAVPGMIISTPG